MSKINELKNLLEKEVIPELNDYIDDLFEIIAAKQEDDEIKEELKSIQEIKTDFLVMLEEVKNEELTNEECEEILKEIEEMKNQQ